MPESERDSDPSSGAPPSADRSPASPDVDVVPLGGGRPQPQPTRTARSFAPASDTDLPDQPARRSSNAAVPASRLPVHSQEPSDLNSHFHVTGLLLDPTVFGPPAPP